MEICLLKMKKAIHFPNFHLYVTQQRSYHIDTAGPTKGLTVVFRLLRLNQ